eukprot:5830033-Lingulodinium_polyedra.AAC.1
METTGNAWSEAQVAPSPAASPAPTAPEPASPSAEAVADIAELAAEAGVPLRADGAALAMRRGAQAPGMG